MDIVTYAVLKKYVLEKIEEAAFGGVDLSNYYNKWETEGLIDSKIQPITEEEIRSLFA